MFLWWRLIMLINKIQYRYYIKKNQGYSDSHWHWGILRFVQLRPYSEPPKASKRFLWYSVEASKIKNFSHCGLLEAVSYICRFLCRYLWWTPEGLIDKTWPRLILISHINNTDSLKRQGEIKRSVPIVSVCFFRLRVFSKDSKTEQSDGNN